MNAALELQRRLVNALLVKHLADLRRSGSLRGAALHEFRARKLRGLLVDAYRRHPFYRDLMDGAGFRPGALRGIEDLAALPPVTRAMYRAFTESAVAAGGAAYDRYFRDSTSGSTGQPLPIYRTWNERAYMLAKFMRVLFQNGYRLRDRMLWMPTPLSARGGDTVLQKLGLMRRRVVPFSEPVPMLAAAYLEERPDVFFANKAHLVQIALHLRAEHRVPDVRPKLTVTVGEVLDAPSRRLLEDVFGRAGLLDAYGALELSNLAWRRLADGGPFTFHHDTAILETGDDGEALITDLNIRSFPLIRYRLGDRIDTETGPDGLPVLKAVRGREDDLLRFRDGSTCGGPVIEVIMEQYPDLRQYRVVQEDFDRITVYAALRDGADPHVLEPNLRADFERLVRPGLVYRFEFPPRLEPEANGKLRMLVSRLPRET